MKYTIIFLATSFIFLSATLQASIVDNSTKNLYKYQISKGLNENDIRILEHMREEEKLARDVYDYFYIKYNLPIFNNISNAEQRHMDRVLSILKDNGIKDPASLEPGVFNNITLQKLYDDLISQGKKSLIDALKVGASIEDVDIKDLIEFSKETKNTSILNTFDMLTCGSRNHMRAFIRMLNSYDEIYVPQYISETLFNEIINGNHEKCGQNNESAIRNKKGKGFGNGMGRGNGKGKLKSSRNGRSMRN